MYSLVPGLQRILGSQVNLPLYDIYVSMHILVLRFLKYLWFLFKPSFLGKKGEYIF